MNGENALATLRQAGIWIGLAAGVFVLWEIRLALLLALGAILMAILLHLIAHLICRATGIAQGAALALAVTCVAGVLVLCGWLFGTQLSSQFLQLGQHIQQGGQSLGKLLGRGAQAELARAAALVADMVPVLLTDSLQAVEYTIVVAIAAIYLAAQPAMYRDGAAMLFPRSVRTKAIEGFDLVGVSLKLWMTGQLILMAMVGVLSFGAAAMLGLPDPVALGLVAGLTELVPYLGPFIGGTPAVLVALTQGVGPAVWIVIAYLGIHLVEGYLAAPLLQRWFVHIPPALVLIAIVAGQLFFGLAGFIFGAPLAVVCFTVAKFLYVGETLKQPVDIPREAPF